MFDESAGDAMTALQVGAPMSPEMQEFRAKVFSKMGITVYEATRAAIETRADATEKLIDIAPF